MWIARLTTPLGEMEMEERDEKIVRIAFCREDETANETFRRAETPLLREAARQLTDYFAGRRRQFDLPLAHEGTPFQTVVWRALLDVPYGKTATYGEIARRIGRPTAARAVGQAIHRNPIGIVVPCHRIIGKAPKTWANSPKKNLSLVGYAAGIEKKTFLLTLEESVCLRHEGEIGGARSLSTDSAPCHAASV